MSFVTLQILLSKEQSYNCIGYVVAYAPGSLKMTVVLYQWTQATFDCKWEVKGFFVTWEQYYLE